MATNNEISKVKSYLMKLSDKELYRMLRLASANSGGEATDGPKEKKISYGSFTLSKEAEKQYVEFTRLKRIRPTSMDADHLKWLNIVDTLKTLKYEKPTFYDDASDRDIYLSLVKKFEENNLPHELADLLISSIMTYIHTGYMRPLLFNGSSGCGKTTASRIIAEVMGLKSNLISVPHVSSNHGLAGDSKTFKCPDMGAVGYSFIKTSSLNPLLILDEIDKDCEPETHAAIKDELLSMLDDSANEFYDNFLSLSFDVSRCPIILTSNVLEKVSKPLVDRCLVINYPDITEERLQKILERYCENKLNSYMSNYIMIDTSALFEASHKLYSSGVHSIRKHQEFADIAIGKAYVNALKNNELTETNEEFFSAALEKMNAKGRAIGF